MPIKYSIKIIILENIIKNNITKYNIHKVSGIEIILK